MSRKLPEKRKSLWEQFEKEQSNKRTGKTTKGKVPEYLTVQRMSATTNNKQRYEPLEPRVFVDFREFTEFTIENIKSACEKHYIAPTGTCDVLMSDKGPSCFVTDHVVGKQFLLVRFNYAASLDSSLKAPPSKRYGDAVASTTTVPSNHPVTKSISVVDLLRARKLIKPMEENEHELVLESYEIKTSWRKHKKEVFFVEKEKFDEGGFRECFHARCKSQDYPTNLVVKQLKAQKVKDMVDVLGISVEEHTRKQVQMHTVANELVQKFNKLLPVEFGETFTYNQVYYTILNSTPSTVEEYVLGKCTKYINNNGTCEKPVSEEMRVIYEKAETLVHFSYFVTEEKMMLLDLQGSRYALYDPEIATSELLDEDGAMCFCTGNLGIEAIKEFFKEHICNNFCDMLNLEIPILL